MTFPVNYIHRAEKILRKTIYRVKRRWRRKLIFTHYKNFVYFLVHFILIILPTEAVVEDYKTKYENYDYYGDYDSMDDDANYAELGPGAYDYDEKSETIERPKKAVKNTIEAEADSDSVHTCEDSSDCELEVPGTTCLPAVAAPITTPSPSTTTVCITTDPTTTCKTTTWRVPTTECVSVASAYIDKAFQTPQINHDQTEKAKELRDLVQHLYISQARVQLEASEIKKAQAIANEAQQQLEEAANHVRAVTAALQNAQQEVATSAIRAQTAQLQLAAHDQLLFAARQDVDALSSRMVGLQAAEGIAQPQVNFDIGALMQKLRQPLMDGDKPTPVPSIAMPNSKDNSPAKTPSDFYYDDDYEDY